VESINHSAGLVPEQAETNKDGAWATSSIYTAIAPEAGTHGFYARFLAGPGAGCSGSIFNGQGSGTKDLANSKSRRICHP
jgi:hypothetical protein